MKKYLLTISYVLLAASANAENFFYEYDVIANGFYGYSQYSDKYRQLYKHHHTPVNAEISTLWGDKFSEDLSFSLGIDGQIAGGKELEDYNQGDWGENVYGSLNTLYGEFTVGQVYNAAYQMAVGAPSVGFFRANNSPITDFIYNPNWRRYGNVTAYRTLNSTYLNADADAFKVSYITPVFYNSKLAVSYTPDSYSKAGLINKDSTYDNCSSYAIGLYNDWDTDFVEIESSLGYAYNHKNNQEISAGLSLYRKGWTLGGSYRKSYTSSNDYSLNERKTGNMPQYFDLYRRGQAYNLGLSYEIGPFKTGVTYFQAKSDKKDYKDEIVTWANRFAINKYVGLYLATAYARYKGDEINDSNKGYAFMGGVELSF